MIIDLHTHTLVGSDDSYIDIDELIEKAKKSGLDGVCITDHDWFWRQSTIERFCRELELVTLEEAIRRVTSFPAARVRLADRGVLREGAFADLVVFDLASIGDSGTLLDPQTAVGIEHVFVNGEAVVREGRFDADVAPGRALRRAA